MEKKKYLLPDLMIDKRTVDIIVMSGMAIDDGNDNELGGTELDLGGIN